MTQLEKRILLVLQYDWRWPDGGNSWKSFNELAETLDEPLEDVREATHSLTDEGYLQYGTAWGIDYMLRGSGYFLTSKGENYGR